MSDKTDFLFLNIKQLYPMFARPSALDTEIWAELLQPYALTEIMHALKAYRKNEENNFPPNPAKFKNYLYTKQKDMQGIPFSPEGYLMQQDMKAGRCKYFYPVYRRGVAYVIDNKLRALYPKAEFHKLTVNQKYHLAVENGLFGDFDKVLDLVADK